AWRTERIGRQGITDRSIELTALRDHHRDGSAAVGFHCYYIGLAIAVEIGRGNCVQRGSGGRHHKVVGGSVHWAGGGNHRVQNLHRQRVGGNDHGAAVRNRNERGRGWSDAGGIGHRHRQCPGAGSKQRHHRTGAGADGKQVEFAIVIEIVVVEIVGG